MQSAGIKKQKSIIQKKKKEKKKKHDKIVLLAKLSFIEVFISKPLIDLVISHDEFVLINNAKRICGNEKRSLKT